MQIIINHQECAGGHQIEPAFVSRGYEVLIIIIILLLTVFIIESVLLVLLSLKAAAMATGCLVVGTIGSP